MKTFLNKIHQLYHWTLKWADHKHNNKALGFLAFIESSFFLIPPDALLIPMGCAQPKKALKYALNCTVFSVLGGLLGYWIGQELWLEFSDFITAHLIKAEHFEVMKEKFSDHAFLSIFIAALTPIPYKVFTITAGAVALPLSPFIFASILGRGLRFFAVSLLLYKFGDNIKNLIEKHFDKFTILLSILLITFIYLIKDRF